MPVFISPEGRPERHTIKPEGYFTRDEWIDAHPDVFERYRARKLKEISAAYSQFDATGTTMTSLGFPIQVGQSHCANFDRAVRFAEMNPEQTAIYITDANNVTHLEIPLTTARQVLTEQHLAARLAHGKKQSLRAQVMDAETVEELDDIEVGF